MGMAVVFINFIYIFWPIDSNSLPLSRVKRGLQSRPQQDVGDRNPNTARSAREVRIDQKSVDW